MRAKEFVIEAGLRATGLRPQYLSNLIKLIRDEQYIPLIPGAHSTYGKSTKLSPQSADILQQVLDRDGGNLDPAGYIILSQPIPTLSTEAGKNLLITKIEKSTEVKGKDVDFNAGDIGEIALGVAAGSRFLNAAQIIDEADFINFFQLLELENVRNAKGKILNSLKLTYTGTLEHSTGKNDNLSVIIVAPGRSVKYFYNIMQTGQIPEVILGYIRSAIKYANESTKIEVGVKNASTDPNTNMIEIICDGVSDQKGTKADLVMTIDGRRITLLSAKAGDSQLGQASGHDWAKQVKFFEIVFQVDVGSYKKLWGDSNEAHLTALREIYTKEVIPKILRLTGGHSVNKEKLLIKSISNGLIKYSNDVLDSGEIETVDIVKLISSVGQPGYKLLRIDKNLTEALLNSDLYGEANPSGLGIKVYGIIHGNRSLLFSVRSYHSPAAKTVRTIIEGGPFLDDLATVNMELKQPEVNPVNLPNNIDNTGPQ